MKQPTSGIRRRNYGRGHGYKIDGRKVEGVTTLVKEGLPAPFLAPWNARTVAEYAAAHVDEIYAMRGMGQQAIVEVLRKRPFEVMVSAGRTGTQIHAIAERLARGEEVEVEPNLQPWVQSALDYINDFNPKPVLQEQPVGSRRWRYGGTLDDVSDFPEPSPLHQRFCSVEGCSGTRKLADYKTGKSIYEEVALQLAAYRNAEFYMDGEEERSVADLGICEEAYAVHIRPEGYEVWPVHVGAGPMKGFLYVATVARMRQDDGPLSSWLASEPLPKRKNGESE